MKLYATVTSERATKGQGGEWLEFTITDKNKSQLWGIQVRDDGEKYNMLIWNRIEGKIIESFIPHTKGEKQKAEYKEWYCKECQKTHDAPAHADEIRICEIPF
jgi:hypothetical protein